MYDSIKYDGTYVLDFLSLDDTAFWLRKKDWFDDENYVNVGKMSYLLGSSQLYKNKTFQSIGQNITHNSRLYIIGHGKPGLNAIASEEHYALTTEQFSVLIANVLSFNSIFKLNQEENNLMISMIVCGAAAGVSSPMDSLAANLQRILRDKYGLWVNIVARTQMVGVHKSGKKMTISWKDEQLFQEQNELYQAGIPFEVLEIESIAKHKKPGSKLLFKWLADGTQTVEDAYEYTDARTVKLEIIEYLRENILNPVLANECESYVRTHSLWDLKYEPSIHIGFKSLLRASQCKRTCQTVMQYLAASREADFASLPEIDIPEPTFEEQLGAINIPDFSTVV